jgi:hypothetical protein
MIAMEEFLSNCAHQIASEWHGGQSTQLYSFLSTGKVFDKDALLAEIRDDIEQDTEYSRAENARELAMLYLFVQAAPEADEWPERSAEEQVSVVVTRSSGHDRAVVVMVDTGFEPDASDGSPGLRILLNDEPVYEGVAYAWDDDDNPSGAVVVSPSGWHYRSEQENGDSVDCWECGNPLNDDLPIVNDDEGYAYHAGHLPVHDPAGRTLPEWERLMKLPVMYSNHTADLRLEVHYPAETNFADVRLWTTRGGLADGEPFEHTVYVEVRDIVMAEIMPGAGGNGGTWYDLGHYDGDNPPEGLPGLTATALRNMIDLPDPE